MVRLQRDPAPHQPPPLSAVGQLPDKPPRYMMNQSTIIMPCNNSGYMDPKRTVGWSIIDFDWSNYPRASLSSPLNVLKDTYNHGCY